MTTAIQLADIIAYLIAWGVRVGGMVRPPREELNGLAEMVRQLRYRSVQERRFGEEFTVWSFAVIDDLRPRVERDEPAEL